MMLVVPLMILVAVGQLPTDSQKHDDNAEYRVWTNTQGSQIVAKLAPFDDGAIIHDGKIRLEIKKTGRISTYPINQLKPEDRGFVQRISTRIVRKAAVQSTSPRSIEYELSLGELRRLGKEQAFTPLGSIDETNIKAPRGKVIWECDAEIRVIHSFTRTHEQVATENRGKNIFDVKWLSAWRISEEGQFDAATVVGIEGEKSGFIDGRMFQLDRGKQVGRVTEEHVIKGRIIIVGAEVAKEFRLSLLSSEGISVKTANHR